MGCGAPSVCDVVKASQSSTAGESVKQMGAQGFSGRNHALQQFQTPLFMQMDMPASSEDGEQMQQDTGLHKVLLDVMPCAIFVRDANSAVRFINRAGLSLMGLATQAELVPWQVQLKPLDRPEASDALGPFESDATEADLPRSTHSSKHE